MSPAAEKTKFRGMSFRSCCFWGPRYPQADTRGNDLYGPRYPQADTRGWGRRLSGNRPDTPPPDAFGVGLANHKVIAKSLAMGL